MASGKSHFISSCLLTPVTIAVAYKYNIILEPVLLGSLLGIFITPDVDMSLSSYNETILYEIVYSTLYTLHIPKYIAKTLGKFAQGMLQITFSPLCFLLPHRSIFSHMSPLSVAIKALWLYALYFTFCKVFDISILGYEYFVYNKYYQIIFIIWSIHDAVHGYILDGAMMQIFGRKVYLLSWLWYKAMHRLFNTDK